MSHHSTFESMVLGSTDLVVAFNSDGSINLVNKAFLDALGYSKKELDRLGISRIVSHDYVDDVRNAIDSVFNGLTIDGIEAVFLANDGTPVYVQGNIFPRKENGDVVAAQGFFRDRTEEKKAETNSKLERQRRDFFVDLMTHDLTNINQEVFSTFEILLHSEELSPELAELVKGGLKEVQRAASLIDNVKKISYLMTSQPNIKSINLQQAMNQSLERAKNEFEDKDIVIQSNLESQDYHVLADEYLGDVFHSLLHNSMKFAQGKDVHVTIMAEPIMHTPFVRIEVSDRGPGIPDYEKEGIFTDSSHRRERILGLGLGLTLVKKLVENYGGRIFVKDRVEGDHTQGARFVLLLRLASEHQLNDSKGAE